MDCACPCPITFVQGLAIVFAVLVVTIGGAKILEWIFPHDDDWVGRRWARDRRADRARRWAGRFS
jgi:hypothetical protein